ncbi:MAG: substrate-binding domain-containing protein [Pseudomonadota bacterium]
MVWTALSSGAVHARDHIHIVGSSTVFPFVTTAAEEFGQKTQYGTPIVEQLGTGGGLKLFCSGLGATAPFDYPDIANASRRIKPSERALCQRNGVSEIIELKIGYDGIVLANAAAGPNLALTTRQLYLALAKWVPSRDDAAGGFVENPYLNWSDVSPDLPDMPIRVIGPPETSGTRDAFNTLAIQAGCEGMPNIRARAQRDARVFGTLCTRLRADQRYIEAGENDNLIVQKLRADPKVVGVLPFSFLAQNTDVIKPAQINGAIPAPASIRSREYPIARSLYVYIKSAHARSVPGVADFLSELISDAAMGEFGYLRDKGLIALADPELSMLRNKILSIPSAQATLSIRDRAP